VGQPCQAITKKALGRARQNGNKRTARPDLEFCKKHNFFELSAHNHKHNFHEGTLILQEHKNTLKVNKGHCYHYAEITV
jgi:hypothetical protein